MNKRTSKWEKAQERRKLENQCWQYLKPVLAELHQNVDRRLVKTMVEKSSEVMGQEGDPYLGSWLCR